MYRVTYTVIRPAKTVSITVAELPEDREVIAYADERLGGWGNVLNVAVRVAA